MDALYELIGWLFSNPIIAVVVIGIITSLFGKRKTEQSGGEAKRKRIPEVIKETLGEYFSEEEKPSPRKTIQEKNVPNEIETKLQQAREITEQNHSEVRKSPVFHYDSIDDSQSPIYKPDLKFDRKKLVDGIIMAEVLGPPKSRVNKRR
ncbi:hypothetical protein [Bacillus sp. CECT 9360]|uniref:hypothetical protein n=1 Tax=Bacillus sp. CECT 9360 TaxID=2845821 RepID=UPI001E3C72A5|nr:hypothetical protein [Bacillus sp. CECT 9360]CAH0347048.1 hypothetical protein BCI9360_03421 [Bacillus sp. CECT 9360]